MPGKNGRTSDGESIFGLIFTFVFWVLVIAWVLDSCELI
jgi:hypothetical protein